MLLPETKGIALPETVDDVEKLGRYYVIQHSLNESFLLSHGALVIHKGNHIVFILYLKTFKRLKRLMQKILEL